MQTISLLEIPSDFIDLSVGLLRGVAFHHGGGPDKRPLGSRLKRPPAHSPSGLFPLLNGPFYDLDGPLRRTSLNGPCVRTSLTGPFVRTSLNGLFSLLRTPLQTAHKKRPIKSFLSTLRAGELLRSPFVTCPLRGMIM